MIFIGKLHKQMYWFLNRPNLFRMLIFSKYLFVSKSFNALTIWPFIILRDKELRRDKIVLNHEKIHLRQQVELLWIFYFIWYLAEFSINLLRYRDLMRSYSQIGFEKEAYANESDPDYLKKRKFWGFLKYYK